MSETVLKNHWQNSKVAFLGDSITDAIHVGTSKNYWQFLEEMLQIKPLVYGINGQRMCDIPAQAERLFNDHHDNVDAVMVFAGTNDYCGGVPLGEWFTYSDCEVNSHGEIVTRRKREMVYNENTFRGRINIAMKYLKEHFPASQIILLTMLHRGGPSSVTATSNRRSVTPTPADCLLKATLKLSKKPPISGQYQ